MEAEEIRSRSKSSKININEMDYFLDNNQTVKRSDVKDGGSMKHDKQEIGAEINLEEVDNFLDEDDDFVKILPKRVRTQYFGSKAKLVEVDSGEVNTPISNDKIGNLHYKLKNQSEEHPIRQVDGKMECPFCKAGIKNVNIHFQRKPECGGKIDMVHFSNNFEDYKKRYERVRKNKEMQKSREKQMKEDPDNYVKAQQKIQGSQLYKDPDYY